MKRASDETATFRRKKRQRKVVESSSDEGQETSQVETNKLDVSKRQENNDDAVGEVGREPTLEPESAAEVPAAPSPAPKPVVEPVEPIEPEVAEPVDEANQGRKRDNATKVLHAARAWLKAPSRKTDAVMLERCTAMSGLTKKEIADFVEANAKRRPGEWCFTVVDERIRAKKEEQEAIQAATGTVSAPAELSKPSNSQGVEPVQSAKAASEPLAAHRRRAKRPNADIASDGAQEASVPPMAAPVAPTVAAPGTPPAAPPAAPPVAPSESATSTAAREPPTADAKTVSACKKSSASAKPPEKNPPEVDHPPALPAAPPRRRGPKPRASKAVAAVPQASTPCPELSCLDRLEATQSRRKFAPLRPGTRTVQSTATLTATAPKAAVQPPSRSGCRHPKVSKKDCAMVCDICGEELLYDGWRLELCDEFDVYNSATS